MESLDHRIYPSPSYKPTNVLNKAFGPLGPSEKDVLTSDGFGGDVERLEPLGAVVAHRRRRRAREVADEEDELEAEGVVGLRLLVRRLERGHHLADEADRELEQPVVLRLLGVGEHRVAEAVGLRDRAQRAHHREAHRRLRLLKPLKHLTEDQGVLVELAVLVGHIATCPYIACRENDLVEEETTTGQQNRSQPGHSSGKQRTVSRGMSRHNFAFQVLHQQLRHHRFARHSVDLHKIVRRRAGFLSEGRNTNSGNDR